jgi:hypothetical protein
MQKADRPDSITDGAPVRASVDAVQRRLLREAAALAQEMESSQGQVPAWRIRALEEVARLLEICRAAQPPPARERWPVVAVIGVTLVIATVLFFVRVRATEIELNAKAVEIGFVLRGPAVITDALQVGSIGVAGVGQIRIPGQESQETSLDNALLVSTVPGTERSQINLAALVLPADTRVSLRKLPAARQYVFSFQRPGVDLRADVYGTVRLAGPGAPREDVEFPVPTGILFKTGDEEVVLTVELLPATHVSSLQLPIANLTLVDISRHFEQSAFREVSTLQSGTLYFESLGGAERKLREGEELRFGESQGELRSIRLEDETIVFQFHGEVGALTTGAAENRRNLMPTHLEWLSADHGVTLLWGTSLYLFTILAAVMRWWGKPL